MDSFQQVGYNDIRAETDASSGFVLVTLKDADDGDVIVVGEDDIVALRNYLTQVITQYELDY